MIKYKKFLIVFAVILGLIIILAGPYIAKQLWFMYGPIPTDNVVVLPPEQRVEPNRISIPSLGISAPIVESLASNEQAFQEALKVGVVHYPGTAEVGQIGNAYLFGHSSDLLLKGGDYKTVFALLPRIQKDAEILVSDKEGNQFVYKVYDQFVAESSDVHLLDQNTDGKKILTIQTSYPIGTALKRYIVKAELKQ